MSSAAVALSCARGEDVTFPLTHVTSDTDSTVKNITGWTIAAFLRDEANTIVATLTAAIVSGAAGTYTLSATSAQTKLQPKVYKLDIWRTDASSNTLMGIGTLEIKPDVRFAV